MKTFLPICALAILLAFFAFSANEKEALLTDVDPKTSFEIEDAMVIKGRIKTAILETSNGCGVGNFLIPMLGDSSQGLAPMLGTLSNDWPEDFKILETIPGTKITGIAFKRDEWMENTSIIRCGDSQYPYVIISDIGMFSYLIPGDFDPWSEGLTKLDSIMIPGIVKMAKQITIDETNPIVLYVRDSMNSYSLRFYSYPELQEQFSFPFHFEPEIFEVTEDGLFVTGLDTSGSYRLYHFSALQHTLLGLYPLNEDASNAQEFLKLGDSLFIMSSPGDSVTMLSTIDLSNSALSQSVVYPKSGARASYNDFKNNKYFTFQPIADHPDSLLDKQILIFDPLTNQMDTLILNLELDYFKQPKEENHGFGLYPLYWLGAKWQGGISDTVYLGQYFDALKIEAMAFPQYINATYGCWVSVNENELDKIKFELYPNPASSEITVNLSGLTKDRPYKLDIIDNSGRLMYFTHLKAYQKIELPLQQFEKGMYFLKLDTGRNLITKKLIIQ